MRGLKTIAAAVALTTACSGSPEVSAEKAVTEGAAPKTTVTVEAPVEEIASYEEVVLDLRKTLAEDLSSQKPQVYSNIGNCALVGNENVAGSVDYDLVGHPFLLFKETEMIEGDAVLTHAGVKNDSTLTFGATVLVEFDDDGNVEEVKEAIMPGEARGLNIAIDNQDIIPLVELERSVDGNYTDSYGNSIGVIIKSWENTVDSPEGFTLASIEACREYMTENFDSEDYAETSTLDA